MAAKILGAVLALALLFSIPVLAHADTYAPGTTSQTFSTDQGGWTQTTKTEGACVASLLCATVVNNWTNAGGADNDGYIRTQVSSTLTTEPGTSVGVWSSPAFTYAGTGGQVPKFVTFDLSIRPVVNALLGASALNEANYRVDLIDQATGTGLIVIPATPLVNDSGWTSVPTVSVNPSQLVIGHGYKIQISTSYRSTAAVLATGEVGYDNVRLTTSNGVATSGITSRKQLRELTKAYILPGSVKLVGDKLKMKLRCPAIAAPKPCKVQVQGLAKGKFSAVATARKFVTIKAGKKRVVKIRVKPRYLASYKVARKIWVKSTVRVGSIRVTVRKRVKLKH